MFRWYRPDNGAPGFLQKSAMLASGQAVGYVLVLVAAPVLSRHYGPDDFGLLATFIALMSLFGAVATLRYENAIPLPKDNQSAVALKTLSRILVVVVTTCALVFSVLWGDTLEQALFASSGSSFFLLVTLSGAALASYQIQSAWMLRNGQFAALSRVYFVFTLVCLAVQLLVPLCWSDGPIGLLGGHLVGYTAATLFALLCERRERTDAGGDWLIQIRRVAARYRKYPLFDLWSSSTIVLSHHGQALLFVWLFGPTVAGSYLLAQRVLTTPMSLVGRSFSRVYYSDAAVLATSDADQLPTVFRKVSGRLLLWAGPPTALFCLLAPLIFGFVFGPEWRDAGIYCALLGPYALLRLLANVLAPTLDVIDRQGLRFACESVNCGLILGGVVFARSMEWSELVAVALTSSLGCVGAVLLVVATWWALQDHCRQSPVVNPFPIQAKAA